MVKIKKIELNPITAYLAGVIIGDGHISNSTKSKTDLSKDYRIGIELSGKEYLEYLIKLIKDIIITKSTLRESKRRGKKRLYFLFRNKSFFYFLTEDLRIPNGAKSKRVFVPEKIKNSNLIIKKNFIAGLFDTDGGFRGGGIGFTSASEELTTGTSDLLKLLGIAHSGDKWLNKKYGQIYYGIRIYKKEIDNFLNMVPLRNKEKLEKIKSRFFSHHAELPEWSNGTDHPLSLKG
ncbi:hypothetical protein GOV03_05130 [Candidatus Woesearchaeota archaeon]|nr:hypothetical protein [Candidatus Woesearchaeota archaeon]